MRRSIESLPGSSFEVQPGANETTDAMLRWVANPDDNALFSALSSSNYGHRLFEDWSTLGRDSRRWWLDESASFHVEESRCD